MRKHIRDIRAGGRNEGSQGEGAGAQCLCSSVQEGNELIVLLFHTTSPGLLHPPQSTLVFLLYMEHPPWLLGPQQGALSPQTLSSL